MWRYRIRIVLLALGMVAGYSLAYTQFTHARGYGHFDHHHCSPFGWADEGPRNQPAKPVK